MIGSAPRTKQRVEVWKGACRGSCSFLPGQTREPLQSGAACSRPGHTRAPSCSAAAVAHFPALPTLPPPRYQRPRAAAGSGRAGEHCAAHHHNPPARRRPAAAAGTSPPAAGRPVCAAAAVGAILALFLAAPGAWWLVGAAGGCRHSTGAAGGGRRAVSSSSSGTPHSCGPKTLPTRYPDPRHQSPMPPAQQPWQPPPPGFPARNGTHVAEQVNASRTQDGP